VTLSFGRVVLVPAGEQAPAGQRVAAEDDRLVLAAGDGAGDRWSVAAADAELIETPACGTYLRVGRATEARAGEQPPVALEPGLYQVIRA
jgi:hypothetical protein